MEITQENLMENLLLHVKKEDILCAHIEFRDDNFDLPVGHSPEGLRVFLESINIDYQYDCVYGTVWHKDGSWSESEYDPNLCRQWWEHRNFPEIPENLK